MSRSGPSRLSALVMWTRVGSACTPMTDHGDTLTTNLAIYQALGKLRVRGARERMFYGLSESATPNSIIPDSVQGHYD